MKHKRKPIIVILDNIRSALNVGAIFRTCDAANVEKLYLCGITAYPPHNRIPKTALGATESVPWEHCTSTQEAILLMQQAKKRTLISIETDPQAQNLWDYSFPFPAALIFGNEISGISEEILTLSDTIVKIPMFGDKKSLNVATSCGVVLYEALRQYEIRDR